MWLARLIGKLEERGLSGLFLGSGISAHMFFHIPNCKDKDKIIIVSLNIIISVRNCTLGDTKLESTSACMLDRDLDKFFSHIVSTDHSLKLNPHLLFLAMGGLYLSDKHTFLYIPLLQIQMEAVLLPLLGLQIEHKGVDRDQLLWMMLIIIWHPLHLLEHRLMLI